MDRRCGGLSVLSRYPASGRGVGCAANSAGGLYAAAAACRLAGAGGGDRDGECADAADGADLGRQVVAQNLLVILHEVESRLQEELAAVEGISSKLRQHAGTGLSGASAARRASRSIWSDARPRSLPSPRPALGLDGVRVGNPNGTTSPAAGCGDWLGCASRAAVAMAAPGDHPTARSQVVACGSATAARRPSWLSTASSYKYFLGQPLSPQPTNTPDRPPCWLSRGCLPPGHPLGHPLDPLRAPLSLPVREPNPRSLPMWSSQPWGCPRSETAALAPQQRHIPEKASVTPALCGLCSARWPPSPAERPMSWEFDSKPSQPSHGTPVEASVRESVSVPVQDSPHRHPVVKPAETALCELQEVFKNERVLESERSQSPEPERSDSPPQPRAPAASPAPSPPPPEIASVPSVDAAGAAGAAWLVDAVHLLKEYYLKRAQLSLQANIVASRQQLVVPERDVCCRDVGVGDAAVSTSERASGPDALLPTLAAGSADASTSPRPPSLSSRTTQTRPVLCQPIHKAGDYQWLATDAFNPDLTLYVSCFDEADARTRP